MKKLILWLFFISFPFFIVIAVNENAELPSNNLLKEKCSRYCHNVKCVHTEQKQRNGKLYQIAHEIYINNIQWLKNNPFGLSYQRMNLLIYVVVFPLLMAILLGNLIRKI